MDKATRYRTMLRRLTHVALCMSDFRDQGEPLTPEMWANLRQLAGEARDLLRDAKETKS